MWRETSEITGLWLFLLRLKCLWDVLAILLKARILHYIHQMAIGRGRISHHKVCGRVHSSLIAGRLNKIICLKILLMGIESLRVKIVIAALITWLEPKNLVRCLMLRWFEKSWWSAVTSNGGRLTTSCMWVNIAWLGRKLVTRFIDFHKLSIFCSLTIIKLSWKSWRFP